MGRPCVAFYYYVFFYHKQILFNKIIRYTNEKQKKFTFKSRIALIIIKGTEREACLSMLIRVIQLPRCLLIVRACQKIDIVVCVRARLRGVMYVCVCVCVYFLNEKDFFFVLLPPKELAGSQFWSNAPIKPLIR